MRPAKIKTIIYEAIHLLRSEKSLEMRVSALFMYRRQNGRYVGGAEQLLAAVRHVLQKVFYGPVFPEKGQLQLEVAETDAAHLVAHGRRFKGDAQIVHQGRQIRHVFVDAVQFWSPHKTVR